MTVPRPSSSVPAAPATEAAAVRKLAEHIIAREQAWRVDQQDPPGLRDGHRRPSSSALDLARSSLALVSLVAAAEQQRDAKEAGLRIAWRERDHARQDRHDALTRAEAAERRAAETEAALREIVSIHDDRFDRHEGYMSGIGLAGRIASAALSAGGPERTTT